MPVAKNPDHPPSGPAARPARARGLTAAVAILAAIGLLFLLSFILRDDPGRGRPRGDRGRAALTTGGAGTTSKAAARSLLDRMGRVRQQPRRNGWALELRDLVRSARRAKSDDDRGRLPFQTELVASMVGVDARLVRRMPGFGAYYVTTNSSADRLLLGGSPVPSGGTRRFTARAMLHATLPAIQLDAGGMGPVAFRDDATPLQLIARPGEPGQPDELSLVDLSRGEVATRFDIPGRLAIRYYQELGLAADGSAAAAPVRGADGRERLVVWKAGASRHRFEFPIEGRCLAFTADGSLVAAGDEKGSIGVWSMTTGERLPSLSPGTPAPVACLAFGPARFESRGGAGGPDATRPGGPARVRAWPLAAGDAHGAIRIRSIREPVGPGRPGAPPPEPAQDREPVCQASDHAIACLAFSADGTLLVSCGEDQALLWDPTSGRLLLSIEAGPDLQAAAFSPLGRSLALCSASEEEPGATSIWSIRDGHAIRLLRGSTARFAAVAVSPNPDVPLVAAWARNGQVAVWERRAGVLLHSLATPPLVDPELSALDFSPDGRMLAYSGGGEASVWDLQEPGAARSWRLAGERQSTGSPVAVPFCTLRFPAPDRLIVTHVDSDQVLRVEDLLAPEPRRLLSEISALGGNVTGLASTPDGTVALVTVALAAQPGNYAVKAFNATTGKLNWSLPLSQSARAGRPLQLTPDGKLVAVLAPGDAPVVLIDVASGEPRSMLMPVPLALGPDAKMWISWAHQTPDDPGGVRFFEPGGAQPAFAIPADLVSGSPHEAAFTPDGQVATWVNADNTVAVCDLATLRARLAEDGLEW